MNEYISIKDFASQAGVSPQALYQRLEKDLKPYLKIIDGKKTLNTKGLELFSLKAAEQQPVQCIDKDLLKTLQETLKFLSSQLEMKDQQILNLNERLKEAQELNKNNQILLGSEQSRTNPSLLINGEPHTQINSETKVEKKGIWSVFKGWRTP